MVYQRYVLLPDAGRRMLMSDCCGGKPIKPALTPAKSWEKMSREIKNQGFHLIVNGQDSIQGVPVDVLVGTDVSKIKEKTIKDVFNELAKELKLPFKSAAWYSDQ
jgi:hypothetical protein